MTSSKETPATSDLGSADFLEENHSFSFVEMEHKIGAFWEQNEIFKKSLKKTDEQGRKKRPYIFYDGPPFATGLPHHGHLVASTLKDIVPRYYTMRGYHVDRRFGWDCHGLPIEQEIDKKFGKSALDIVAELGLAAYNNECRSIVDRFAKEWEKTINRLGRWVDFRNDYKTMDPSFMESVWWVVKQLWDKKLLYQGTKVVPISTTFGTVLSNFEATSNYQSIQDPSVTVLFELAEKVHGEKCHLLVWTTTPWTLPSNLGLCVNADVTYVRVHETQKNLYFYMAKERLEALNKNNKNPWTVCDEVLGQDLVGKKYHPLLPYFAHLSSEGAFQVHADNYVTTADGTGVVHLAPAFGEDDHRVLKAFNRDLMVCPIDVYGKFTSEIPELTGLSFKEADKPIMKRLKEENKLFEQSVLVHSYPMCPRSDTPLMYRVIASWYVAVEEIKSDMIKANQEIRWVPEHIKDGRFGKWLEGARDWAISRNRFWGTPMPLWINDQTQNIICMGSVSELEKYTGKKITDLHREHVDPLTFSIAGEAGVYQRIPEVLDCWFESGSMPYAQLHYPFENQDYFNEGYPAEYIAEGLDQTRGWFYTLTVLSAALFKKPAFKNVIVNGLVQAADGKKMSKRLKNYTAPDILMESFGADALRLYLINSGVVKGEELRFTDEGVKDMVRRVLLPWYNSFKFFMTYSSLDGWSPEKDLRFGNNILDQWILSKLQTLIGQVNTEMQAYRLYNVVPVLFSFVEDLTNWYIRLNRRRFWGEGIGAENLDKQEAYSTLYTAVKTLSVLLAPFAPYLSEYIYQELKKLGGIKSESIHLESYPDSDHSKIRKELEEAVIKMQQVILLGRQKRNQVSIKVKTPLAQMTVIHKDPQMLAEMKKLESYLTGELNVKKVLYDTNESQYVHFYGKPNSPLLGKKLGKDFAKMRGEIEKLPSSTLEELESKGQITLGGYEITKEEILLFREARAGTQTLSNQYVSLDMDITLNQDLIYEGLAREIVNRIQKTRKELNFEVGDRIHVMIQQETHQTLKAVVSQFTSYIKDETLMMKLDMDAPTNSQKQLFTYEIEKYTLHFYLEKITA